MIRYATQKDENAIYELLCELEGMSLDKEGFHEAYGGLHAERNALKSCTKDPNGAELYVTLEPCCHYGRTPPCTEAVIKSGIRKVYVGNVDPNPKVAGMGIKILREHGIEAETGILDEECRGLNDIFFYYITHDTPYVVLKYAMTLDGKIAVGQVSLNGSPAGRRGNMFSFSGIGMRRS